MTKDEATRRVMLSRSVISGWEALGAPLGPPEDTLRMIREEIAILERIGAEHPERALTVGDLVRRYRDMAERVKMLTSPIDAYTLVLAIFTVVLAVSTILLWWEARSARIDARREADQTRQTLRAWMTIDSGNVSVATVDHQDGYGVHINLKNTGGSAAVSVRTWLSGSGVFEFAAVPFNDVRAPANERPASIVGAGASITIDLYAVWASRDFEEVRQERKAIFIWGGVEYQDIFGAQHQTVFRMRISGPPGVNGVWGLRAHPIGYEYT